jgi:hypothetical protein
MLPKRMISGPVIRMTQFYRAKDDDTQFRGSCGQTALAVCIAAATGRQNTFEAVGELMIALTRDMIEKGIAAPNGAAPLVAYAREARDWGLKLLAERPYQEPLPDWMALLREHAGINPILLQVACGEALIDAETGQSDQKDLRYHAVAIVGCDERGYIACDGAHPEATRRFQIYDERTITSALPCGFIALEPEKK